MNQNDSFTRRVNTTKMIYIPIHIDIIHLVVDDCQLNFMKERLYRVCSERERELQRPKDIVLRAA